MHFSTASFLVAALCAAPFAAAVNNYPNEFPPPEYVLNHEYPDSTLQAQQTVIQWADKLAGQGPWSVTTKQHLAPSGDIHDYMSWAPYYWPNCANATNTTVLSVDEMHKQCQYDVLDGQLNPDARLINNIGDFDTLANAVLYNGLAWGITRSPAYSQRVANFIHQWFLNPDTKMNPNLKYAQMHGGPDGQTGTHTGMLDLKCMAKIASSVVLLRNGNADGWNSTIDSGFQSWVQEYIGWLTSDPIALEEKAAPNNHGSFYYAQLASLYLIANDNANAAATVKEYFGGKFKSQINATGNQPLESDRTRPYHYLAYNLYAIITNARIGAYAEPGYNPWGEMGNAGAGIEAATKFAMAFPPNDETASELYPVVAAVAACMGDSDGSYASWLSQHSNNAYLSDANYFWNQPLSDNKAAHPPAYITYLSKGVVGTLTAGATPTGGTNNPSAGANIHKNGAVSRAALSWGAVALGAGVALASAL